MATSSNHSIITIKMINTSTIELTLFGYSVSASWYLKIKLPKIKAVVSSILIGIYLTLTMKVTKIGIAVSSTLLKFIQNLTQTISVKKIKITISKFAQTMKIESSLNLHKIRMGVDNMGLRWVFGSLSLDVPKIVVTASPSSARFKLVNEYDAYYLTDLDAMTLQEMDYELE